MGESWSASIVRTLRSVWGFLILPGLLCVIAIGQSSSLPTSNGKTVEFLSMFRSDSDVEVVRTPCERVRDLFDHSGEAHDLTPERKAVCDQVLDVVAGKNDPLSTDATSAIEAAGVATDSNQRIVVTEPAKKTIHILDFAKRKYTRIDGAKDDRMLYPYAVAVDANDNVYVTDLKRGFILVYSAEGKFKRYIGNFKGEAGFEQPTSIAIDRATGRIYVTDTPRHLVFMLDRDGKSLGHIGKRGGGTGPGEFRFPTGIALRGDELFVLDSKNERIQVFDLRGHYKREIKPNSLGAGSAKGIAVDAEGLIYVLFDVDTVLVFNPQGERLFRFGNYGTEAGEFIDSKDIYIDSTDHIYVTDTGNNRVQIFQITNERKSATR